MKKYWKLATFLFHTHFVTVQKQNKTNLNKTKQNTKQNKTKKTPRKLNNSFGKTFSGSADGLELFLYLKVKKENAKDYLHVISATKPLSTDGNTW